ncbi:hypothetical protein BA195_06800 [Tenacibaculum soleae]|uniref:Phage tail protein n=1 Tax=Tenacibaculum soleae TaxID=447689 RepID=A0A1B9Y3L0_9FLAO|nr:phage tail tube protein [Tenacibaculum soleae]OCK44380.1 hypothetical protein BA195_06800 [Tenacibaculum soleae]
MAAGLDYKGNMRIKIGTKTVMHEVECSFSSNTEFEEIATKDIEGKEFSASDITWSMSSNAVASNSTGDAQVDIKEMLTSQIGKQLVQIELTDDVSGNLTISGSAYIEGVNITSNNKEYVKFDYSLKGVGVPVIGEVA